MSGFDWKKVLSELTDEQRKSLADIPDGMIGSDMSQNCDGECRECSLSGSDCDAVFIAELIRRAVDEETAGLKAELQYLRKIKRLADKVAETWHQPGNTDFNAAIAALTKSLRDGY